MTHYWIYAKYCIDFSEDKNSLKCDTHAMYLNILVPTVFDIRK